MNHSMPDSTGLDKINRGDYPDDEPVIKANASSQRDVAVAVDEISVDPNNNDLSSINSSMYGGDATVASDPVNMQVVGSLLGPRVRETVQRPQSNSNEVNPADYYDNDDSSLGLSNDEETAQPRSYYRNPVNYYDNDDSSLGISSINTSVYHERGKSRNFRKATTGSEVSIPVGETIDDEEDFSELGEEHVDRSHSGCRRWRKAMLFLVFALLVGIIGFIAAKAGSANSGNNGSSNSSNGSSSSSPPALAPSTSSPPGKTSASPPGTSPQSKPPKHASNKNNPNRTRN